MTTQLSITLILTGLITSMVAVFMLQRHLVLFGPGRFGHIPINVVCVLCFVAGVLVAGTKILGASKLTENWQNATAVMWMFGWVLARFAGFLVATWERHILVKHHGFQRARSGTQFRDVDGFVDMLAAACEDANMHATLETILTLPNYRRKQMLHTLIEDLRFKNAPRELVDALICLLDDGAAEKAYQAIYQCKRKDPAGAVTAPAAA